MVPSNRLLHDYNQGHATFLVSPDGIIPCSGPFSFPDEVLYVLRRNGGKVNERLVG